MMGYEQILNHNKPDVCLVVGDVNSTVACAIVARKAEVPVVHVEGGIRSFDWSMPEEINRVLTDSITNWFFTRHNWTVEKEWIVPTPGIVPAIQFAINTFCSPGDNILVQGPVYHPFYRVIEASGCKVVSNSLVLSDGGYRMNFSDLETQASDSQLKLAILCSPHNPVGRVWTVEELKQFGEICNDNNVLVIADEIHCDLIGPVSTFVPYLKAGFNFSDRALVCTAPSKTFNLAGLHLSNVIIPNAHLRDQYLAYMKKNAVGGGLNPFSIG